MSSVKAYQQQTFDTPSAFGSSPRGGAKGIPANNNLQREPDVHILLTFSQQSLRELRVGRRYNDYIKFEVILPRHKNRESW